MAAVGILYPGYSAEDDYPLLQHRLGDGYRLPLVHTAMAEDAHRADALREIGSDRVLADGARTVAAHEVDAVMWACTSGSFVFGLDGARRQSAALQQVTGLPTSSTPFAFVAAARALGVGTVSVVATYPAEVAALFTRFLTDSGLAVTATAARGIITAAEVGTLDGSTVRRAAASGARDGAEAVLMPDTALHTVAVLDELEADAGVPVLTANQVSAWYGLRLAGDRTRHDGLGSLFRCATESL